MATYSLTSKGESAKDATIWDVDNAIASMRMAIAHLRRTKGLGTEHYIEKIEEKIERYTRVRNNLHKLK